MKPSSALKPLFAGCCAALFCGCSLLSENAQSPIEYYDLQVPNKLSSVPIDVEPFGSFSGERLRMAQRRDGTRIYGSDFHKWSQAPGSLLTRYLRLAYRNEPADDALKAGAPVTLRGEVLVFEADQGSAKLGVRYTLRRGHASCTKTVLIQEKIEGKGPQAFADAMSRAADRFARLAAAEAAKFPAGRK